MSDSARHAAFYVLETNYGETPATPAFKPIRHTGMTLGVQRGSLQSEELRPDRQIQDFRLGAMTVAGNIDAEFSFASFDDLLEAVTLGTWTAGVLKAGTVRRSFSILRHFTDIDATGEGLPYHLFNGVELNSLQLTVNPTAIVKAVFGTMGREGCAPSNTAPVGSTFANPTTTAPLDAFSGELKDGDTILGDVTELSINLENGLEVRNVVGSKFSKEPSVGRSTLTGSATVYFEDSSMVKKFINETPASISIELPDGEGNSYTITIPRLKYTGGQPDVSGKGPITLSMPFQAILDPVSGSNIVITKTPTS